MLFRLMPSVDALCSSAEVVGGSTPATPTWAATDSAVRRLSPVIITTLVKPQLTVLHTLPSLSWLEIINYLPL